MFLVPLNNLRAITYGPNLMYLKLLNGAKLFSAKLPNQPWQKSIDGEKPKRRKTEPVPKITLISSDDHIDVTTLEEAQHLSKRRDLKLVKIVDLDSKSQRPVYKLMTSSEYHSEDLIQKQQKKLEKENATIKGEKLLVVNAQINNHDLETRVNKVTKWISKKYEVRVIINGSGNNERSENIYKLFEDKLKDISRIVRKPSKGSDLKFQVIPPKPTETPKSL